MVWESNPVYSFACSSQGYLAPFIEEAVFSPLYILASFVKDKLAFNTGKAKALPRQTFFDKVMSLLYNRLSRRVMAFLPRSKRLLISWLQSPSGVILVPKKIKSLTVSTVSPSIFQEVMGLDAMILAFWMLSFKPTFSLSSFIFIKRLFIKFFTLCHKDGVICISWFQLVLLPAQRFSWCTLHIS